LEAADGAVQLEHVLKEIEQDQLLDYVMEIPGSGDKTFAQIAALFPIVRVVYTGKPIVNGAVQEEVLAENGVPFLVAVN